LESQKKSIATEQPPAAAQEDSFDQEKMYFVVPAKQKDVAM
jgi:hypothetical protein